MRVWKCRGCGLSHPRVKQKCPTCGRKRPTSKRPNHKAILDVPYDEWVAVFGEKCGICGRPPSPTRKLDRDHCHASGNARGLLCHRCNRTLKNHVTVEWLEGALAYLRRSA